MNIDLTILSIVVAGILVLLIIIYMLNSNEKYDGECEYFFEKNGVRYCHLRNPPPGTYYFGYGNIEYQENDENEYSNQYVYSIPDTNTAVIQRANDGEQNYSINDPGARMT